MIVVALFFGGSIFKDFTSPCPDVLMRLKTIVLKTLGLSVCLGLAGV